MQNEQKMSIKEKAKINYKNLTTTRNKKLRK